VDTRPGIQ